MTGDEKDLEGWLTRRYPHTANWFRANKKKELQESWLASRQMLRERNRQDGEALSELKEAIRNAQMENSNEVHCSCVPLLKARIHQLEIELAEQKSLIPWIGELAQAKVKIKELEEAL